MTAIRLGPDPEPDPQPDPGTDLGPDPDLESSTLPPPERGDRRGGQRGELDPDTLAALEEQRDHLLASLRDLERERATGDLDEHDYEALKDDYTARAATVIRAIEDGRARFAARPRRSPGRLVAGVVGVIVLAVLMGAAVAQSSGRRGEADTLTGDARLSVRQQLLEAQSLWQTDPIGAIELYDEILEENPSNAEALAYRGWLLRNVAAQSSDPAQQEVLLAEARADLDEAVAADPDLADARVFRARVLADLGDLDGALAELEALDEGDIPPFMAPLVEQLRDEVEAGGAGS